MIEVYLTNLRKYNEGELFGEWLILPMDEEELNEKYKRIVGDDEYFITDYNDEYGFNFGEYENIFELNELFNEVKDPKVVAGIMEWKGYSFREAVEEQDNYEFIEMSAEDWEREIVEECYDLNLDKLGWISNYIEIDYETMAREDESIYEYDDGIIREF